MNVVKIFLISAFLLVFSVGVFAQDEIQTENSKSEKAELVDEFGKLGDCDRSARFDALLRELHNNPNLRGVVIVYQTESVLPANYDSLARIYRNYVRFRRFDANRIEIISENFRKEQTTELWTVPNGVDSPKPSNTIPKPTTPIDKAFIFDNNTLSYYEDAIMSDEFLLDSVKARSEAEQIAEEQENNLEETAEEISNETEVQNVVEDPEIEQRTTEEIDAEKFHWANEKFGEVIKNHKDSRGLIIFYADEQEYDLGKIQTHIEQGVRRITKSAEISPDKIQVIFGGYRNFIEAEFWIIPKKAEQPQPKPEEREVEIIETETNSENL